MDTTAWASALTRCVLATANAGSPIYMAEQFIREEGIALDEAFETGVTECDEFVRRALRCTEEGLTDAERVIHRDQVRQSFRRAPKATVEDRNKLAATCRSQQAAIASKYKNRPCWPPTD